MPARPASPCHYDVLGVQRTASQADIKKAFKKMALKLHPDKNPGDQAAENKFKQLNRAYSVLNDETQKRKYDTKYEEDRRPKAPPSGRSSPRAAAAPASARPRTEADAYGQQYAHYAPNYNHNATKEFISKIIEQDRAVAKHKQDLSFQSWYRQKQDDWKQAESQAKVAAAVRKEMDEREERDANYRAQRLRDIESDLARKKSENERKMELERQLQEERAREFEKKRQAALQDIEREEQRYRDKFRNLESKWADSKAASHVPRTSTRTAAKRSPNTSDDMDEDALEDALREVRAQRDTLRRERQQRKEEAAEAWRQVEQLRTGDYLLDDGLPHINPGSPRSGQVFNWKPTSRMQSGTTAAEELAAARAALRAAEAGEATVIMSDPLPTKNGPVGSPTRSPRRVGRQNPPSTPPTHASGMELDDSGFAYPAGHNDLDAAFIR